VLSEFSQALLVLWPVNLAVSAFLLLLLAARGNFRSYPALATYLALNLIFGIAAFGVYRRWGFFSGTAWKIAWSMQGSVIFARSAAAVETCRHMLAPYRGVWALAWRVLLACAGLVLIYSLLAARGELGFILPKIARGLELAIAAVIVGLFFFVRYYQPEVQTADRLVAVGLCLYSAFNVVNNTILDRYLNSYVPVWNDFSMLAFLASLLLWTRAIWKAQGAKLSQVTLLPAAVYQTYAPQVNLRLRALNNALCKVLKLEVPHS
jgi:hypothetical protein